MIKACRAIQGTDGDDGATGTANVIYSGWITVENSDWLPASGAVLRKNATLNASEITQDHIDHGVVLVYVQKSFDSDRIVLLPMDENEYEFLVDGIGPSEIILKVRRLDLGIFSANFVTLPFRYVIIPGGVAAKDGSQPDFKKMTYEEVMDYFKIPY